MLKKIGSILILLLITFTTAQYVYAASTSRHVSLDADDEIISYLTIINNNEVSISKLALQRSNNDTVKNFAQVMIKDHSANAARLTKISDENSIKPVKSKQMLRIKKEGKQLKASLAKIDVDQFNRAYFSAIIDAHADTLDFIQKKMDDVKSPSLEKFLEETTKIFTQHLAKAKTAIKDM